MALTIMTERACSLASCSSVRRAWCDPKKNSQQVLLTELHDAKDLLGTEWKGFLYELIKGGLDKVHSFVEAENPEVVSTNSTA